MYCVIGASVSSLHRESTDSLICECRFCSFHIFRKVSVACLKNTVNKCKNHERRHCANEAGMEYEHGTTKLLLWHGSTAGDANKALALVGQSQP